MCWRVNVATAVARDMTVTVVTGASRGIGRSLAVRLSRRGEAVALLARQSGPLDEAARTIHDLGGRALPVACDVCDARQVNVAISRVRDELGPVDRLVANAGGGSPTFVEQFSAAQVAEVIQVNVQGFAHAVEAVLPDMLQRRHGHLVAMGSLAAYRGVPTGGAYSAAKAALANLAESLRIDLRPYGIAVTLLQPGFVASDPARGKLTRKPLQMELEAATAYMERAILARRAVVSFPWPMVVAASVLRALPAPLYDRILAGRGRVRGHRR